MRDWLVGVLCTGMLEYCLDHGVRQITSVIDTFLLKLMLSMEWKVRPLGLPQRYPEGMAVAVVVDVSELALASTRRTKHVEGPVLRPAIIQPSRIPASVRLGGDSASAAGTAVARAIAARGSSRSNGQSLQ